MPGIRNWVSGPSGLVRSYVPVVLGSDAPDDTIGLVSRAEGDVAFTCASDPATTVTLPLTPGVPIPAEVQRVVSVPSGGTTYYCVL